MRPRRARWPSILPGGVTATIVVLTRQPVEDQRNLLQAAEGVREVRSDAALHAIGSAWRYAATRSSSSMCLVSGGQ